MIKKVMPLLFCVLSLRTIAKQSQIHIEPANEIDTASGKAVIIRSINYLLNSASFWLIPPVLTGMENDWYSSR
jgi:hypothetical protein